MLTWSDSRSLDGPSPSVVGQNHFQGFFLRGIAECIVGAHHISELEMVCDQLLSG